MESVDVEVVCGDCGTVIKSHYDVGKHIKLCKKNRKARRWVYVQRLQAEEQGGDVIQHRADDVIVLSRKIGKRPENKIKKQIREEDKRKKKTTTTSDSTVEE
ncbi:hypothetical protein Tco_0163074 [Tanacetum coccineum]